MTLESLGTLEKREAMSVDMAGAWRIAVVCGESQNQYEHKYSQ